MPQNEECLAALREAGTSILQGPGSEMKTLYISAALSELHRLLTAAKKEISMHTNVKSNQEFTKRFPHRRDGEINLSKKNILLYLKKLEYYLSWVKNYGTELV